MVTLANSKNETIIRALYNEVASRQIFTSVPPPLKAFYKFFGEVSKAFPDYEIHIESLIEKGNKIMVRYTLRGTHQNGFMGTAPTYEKTNITGIDIFRLENGEVIYHWNSAHQMNILSN